MKTFIRNISTIALLSGVLLASCKKEFLNTKPMNQASAELTWADPNLSEAFVTELYNGLHDAELNQESMDCITDNALYN
ncbi:MAG TPA: hypothetical protein VIM77_07955, partial [Mucilaginibacter sp.]